MAAFALRDRALNSANVGVFSLSNLHKPYSIHCKVKTNSEKSICPDCSESNKENNSKRNIFNLPTF